MTRRGIYGALTVAIVVGVILLDLPVMRWFLIVFAFPLACMALAVALGIVGVVARWVRGVQR